MDAALKQLIDGNPLLWRGRDLDTAAARIKTGFPELDAALPGGGWPAGAVVEIVTREWGSGELRLLLPAMAALSQARRLAWVAPPHVPYAPALANAGVDLSHVLTVTTRGSEILWTAEKLLSSPACGMVLVWPQAPRAQDVRRLQLAAQTGGGTGILLRNRDSASPAALRIGLRPRNDRLQVRILKARGTCRRHSVDLELPQP